MTNSVQQLEVLATPAGGLDVGEIAALAGVGVAVIALLWQMRALRKQLALQTYSDYTKRYQEIILHFPEEINQDDFDLSSRTDRPKVMRYMRAYFDLCFEEYDLSERKLIPTQIWQSWLGGIEFALSKPAFRQAWDQIKADTQYRDWMRQRFLLRPCIRRLPIHLTPRQRLGLACVNRDLWISRFTTSRVNW